MLILGFLFLAVAVAAAIVLVVQNPHTVVQLHGLGQTWTLHLYWVLLIGLVIGAVAALGLALMRYGTTHSWRIRRERRALAAENRRLTGLVAEDRDTSAGVGSTPPAYPPGTPPAYQPGTAPPPVYRPGAAQPGPAAPARRRGILRHHVG